MLAIVCPCCGTTDTLPVPPSKGMSLDGIPESKWSWYTDGVCDGCWFDRYL